MNEDLIKAIYNSGGFEGKGISLEEFSADLRNSPELRQAVHTDLGIGSNGISFEEFESDLRIGITSPTQSTDNTPEPTEEQIQKDRSGLTRLLDKIGLDDVEFLGIGERAESFMNAFDRGLELSKAEGIISSVDDLSELSTEDIQKLADTQRQIRQFGGSEDSEKLFGSETASDFGEAVSEVGVTGVLGSIVETGVESATMFIRSGFEELLGGSIAKSGAKAAGKAIGSKFVPVVGQIASVASLGKAAYDLEFAGAVTEGLQSVGVDTTDPQALEAAFKDENVIEAIVQRAQDKAIPTAIIEALTFGIAGKFGGSRTINNVLSKTLGRKTGDAAQALATVTLEGVGGAGGAAAGSANVGEEIGFGELAAEFLGETASGGPTAIADAALSKETGIGKIAAAIADGDANQLRAEIEIDEKFGQISKEQASELRTLINEIEEIDSTIPTNTGGDKSKIIKLIKERRDLQESKSDEAFSEEQQARIDAINEEIRAEARLPRTQETPVNQNTGNNTDNETDTETTQEAPQQADRAENEVVETEESVEDFNDIEIRDLESDLTALNERRDAIEDKSSDEYKSLSNQIVSTQSRISTIRSIREADTEGLNKLRVDTQTEADNLREQFDAKIKTLVDNGATQQEAIDIERRERNSADNRAFTTLNNTLDTITAEEGARNRRQRAQNQIAVVQGKIDSTVEEINKKINNAEFISESELDTTADQLYEIYDSIESNPNLSEALEDIMLSNIENNIIKLENYELATTNDVSQTEQRTEGRGFRIIGKTSKRPEREFSVTPKRLDNLPKDSVTLTTADGQQTTGQLAKGVSGELDFVPVNPESLKPSETSTVTVKGKKIDVTKKDGTWRRTNKNGTASKVVIKKSLQEEAETNAIKEIEQLDPQEIVDTNFLDFKETIKDESGKVTGVTLVDSRNGNEFTINDSDVALDIAIKAREESLGPIETTELEQVIEIVTGNPEPILAGRGSSQNTQTTNQQEVAANGIQTEQIPSGSESQSNESTRGDAQGEAVLRRTGATSDTADTGRQQTTLAEKTSQTTVNETNTNTSNNNQGTRTQDTADATNTQSRAADTNVSSVQQTESRVQKQAVPKQKAVKKEAVKKEAKKPVDKRTAPKELTDLIGKSKNDIKQGIADLPGVCTKK